MCFSPPSSSLFDALILSFLSQFIILLVDLINTARISCNIHLPLSRTTPETRVIVYELKFYAVLPLVSFSEQNMAFTILSGLKINIFVSSHS